MKDERTLEMRACSRCGLETAWYTDNPNDPVCIVCMFDEVKPASIPFVSNPPSARPIAHSDDQEEDINDMG